MNPIQIIAALRKFGNYLAGLFPWFVTMVNFVTGLVGRIVDHPRVSPHWKNFKENKFVQPAWKVIERFYWRTYSKNRLDLTGAPVEAVSLLRPIFQLCAILCVLIPFTGIKLWPVQIAAFSGFEGIAPGWAVVLWMLSLPCAWAALLTGAARANRVAFMVAVSAASYFLITCVVLLPRSYFNALSPLVILFCLVYCESRCREEETRKSVALGVLNSLVCGIAAGIPLLILTPLRPFLGSVINLPGPVISIGGGAMIGSLLGLGCFALARRKQLQLFASSAEESADAKGIHAMAICAWITAFLLTAYLFAGLCRGSLAQSGSQLISSLTLTTSYFWPLWYFMGVGILHKISKSSKTLAYSVGDVLPAKSVKPLLITLLIVTMTVALSEKVCAILSSSSNGVFANLLPGFFSLYKFLQPSIWSNPLNTLSVHWFSNVLWVDVALVVILAIQRRLTNEALIRLLFLNIFAFLLIWEYVFQMSSFLRTPTHSLTVLFLFSVGLLWLLHTVGWDLSSKSSPAWPAAGRLSIYGGIATFALLEIFARTACSDFKMMNELFLAMFHGVIDIGLPYYFLVWTTNRVKKLPVKIPALLGVFCVGAATALAFNVLEKFAAVGCSLPALNDVVNTQCRTLREIGSVNIDLAIPAVWYFVRAAVYTGVLGALHAFSKRKFANRENASDAILFLLVAFGSGIASFAKTLVELPLPTEVRALLAPCTQELLFDCNLFQNYLAYWIPALLLGLAQLYGRERATKWFLFAIPPAMATHFFISWSYSQYEVYWRACGSLYTILLVPAGIFVIFVALYLDRFASNQEESERDKKATLVTPKTMIAAMAIAELILIPLAFVHSNIKFDHQQMPAISRDISISKTWQRGTDSGVATFVRRKADGGQSSLLQIGTIDSEGLDSRQLLKKLFVQAAKSGQYPNLAVVSVEPWGKYYPNALACNFAYEIPRSNPPMTMAGISVLVPSSLERTEFYTLHTLPSELDHEQYELAWTIKNLGARHTK